MTTENRDLTQGPVGRALLRVSAPMSLGILGVLAVGVADSFFLARVGPDELAAIGFAYPVIVAFSAFSLGMSAGANTALSQAIGRGEDDRAVARLALHALAFGLAIGLTLGLGIWAMSPLLFPVLGAEGAVLDAILVYVPWWAMSFPFLIGTMILNSAFRAEGDGFTPSAIMVLTAVLNVGLTWLLVFGYGPVPAYGMAGAGMGTLLARACGAVLVLGLAIRRRRLAAGPRPAAHLLTSIREITSVGLPAAASRAVNPMGMTIVTAAVATLGAPAVAGFGAATRIEAVALVPFFALSSGLAPVIGQAWGAGKQDRARHAARLAGLFALGYGLGVGLALAVFAGPLADFMTADGDASADYTARYLRIVGLSLAGYGIIVATNSALTARSQAVWALGLSMGRVALIYVPLAWIGVSVFGYTGILAAAVIANILGAWGAVIAAYLNRLLPSRARSLTVPARQIARITGSPDG